MPLLTRTFTYTCPYCWEKNESIADLSVEQQCLVEDCRVCCHPIEIRFTVTDDGPVDLTVDRAM